MRRVGTHNLIDLCKHWPETVYVYFPPLRVFLLPFYQSLFIFLKKKRTEKKGKECGPGARKHGLSIRQIRTKISLSIYHLTCCVLRQKSTPLGPIPGRNSSTQYLTDDDVPEEVQVLSWTPRIFLYKNFLTPEEAQHLVDHHENTRWMSHGDGKGVSHASILRCILKDH